MASPSVNLDKQYESQAVMTAIDLNQLHRSCLSCSLHQLCLPRGLGKNELEKLDSLVETKRQLDAKEILYHAGDNFVGLYAVRGGALKSYLIQADGSTAITGFYLPGEIVGVESIHMQKHPVTVEALDNSAVCFIPYRDLLQLCQAIPSLNEHLMQIISEKAFLNQPEMLNWNAEQRFSSFLLSLSSRLQRRGFSATHIHLPMSRQDIANYLGITPETVSRLIGQFKKSNIIEVEGKDIILRDLRQLQKSVCNT